MEEVKVLGFLTSATAYRVIWALNLKEIKYEYLEDDIFNKSDLLLRLTRCIKRFRCLSKEEKLLQNPLFFSSTLKGHYRRTLCCQMTLMQRAVARFWTKFGDDKKANFLDFFKGAGEEQARAAKDAQEHLAILEEHGLAFWLEAKEEAAVVQVLEVDSKFL